MLYTVIRNASSLLVDNIQTTQLGDMTYLIRSCRGVSIALALESEASSY